MKSAVLTYALRVEQCVLVSALSLISGISTDTGVVSSLLRLLSDEVFQQSDERNLASHQEGFAP